MVLPKEEEKLDLSWGKLPMARGRVRSLSPLLASIAGDFLCWALGSAVGWLLVLALDDDDDDDHHHHDEDEQEDDLSYNLKGSPSLYG